MQASAFGVTELKEFYSKYVAQGCWARCLQCQTDAKVTFTPSSVSIPDPSRSARSHGLSCRICSAQESKQPWRQQLDCNSHGCSACLSIFPADQWTKNKIQHHTKPSQARKLVCKACGSEGFTPSRLGKHTCEDCGKEFGPSMFAHNIIYNAENQAGSQKICKDKKLETVFLI